MMPMYTNRLFALDCCARALQQEHESGRYFDRRLDNAVVEPLRAFCATDVERDIMSLLLAFAYKLTQAMLTQHPTFAQTPDTAAQKAALLCCRAAVQPDAQRAADETAQAAVRHAGLAAWRQGQCEAIEAERAAQAAWWQNHI